MPEGGRLRLFDAVSAFLTAACTEGPTIVVLDDLHAADEPSLLLLRFLGDALAKGEDPARGVLPGGREARARAVRRLR